MLVTARAEYACLAMLELATRYGDPKPARLAELADKHDIPQRYLVQILLHMKGAGLVITTRGTGGGYRLSRKPDTISLADIMNVLSRAEPPEQRLASNSPLANALQAVWQKLADHRERMLREISLADLLPPSARADYMI
jgi:Rrf2 family protein